ncbi:hypothetical protein MRX96_025688 [Rhipicephalus microplus]
MASTGVRQPPTGTERVPSQLCPHRRALPRHTNGSKKSHETHDDDGTREANKSPGMVVTPDAPRPPTQEDADQATLPSTATGPMPSSMVPPSMIPSQPTSTISVETKLGRLVGTLVTVHGVTLAGFLGVPFAQSTAGERRFTAPLPLPASEDACAVHEYLQQRPPCAQLRNGTTVGTEDCLHVNVWTPAAALELHSGGVGRPVVVAVSGKLFETGSNDDSDWPRLAAKGDVVVMVPNHRQGVLGFLNPSDVASMNVVVAVNDVWSALQWARDHAASFGGDPKQLVLVGYGSGAYLLSFGREKHEQGHGAPGLLPRPSVRIVFAV